MISLGAFKLEYRQIAGLLYLGLVIVCTSAASNGRPWWEDLNGMLGLALAFVPALLVPRRWLKSAFGLLSLYFVLLGGFWLLLAVEGRSNDGYPLPIAFFLAAALFLTCGFLAKRHAPAGLG